MTKVIIASALVLLCGCNSHYVPEPKIEASDPVRALNLTKWVPNENDLIWPPAAR